MNRKMARLDKKLNLDRKLNKGLPGSKSQWVLLGITLVLMVAVGTLAALAMLDVQARARGPAQAPAITPTSVPGPSIQLSPAEGEPGTLITVTGEGWRQRDTVFVRLDGLSPDQETQAPVAFAIVTQDGRFNTSFVLPADEAWNNQPDVPVTAWSPATGDEVAATFRVSATPPTPAPTATPTLTPTQAAPSPEATQPEPPPAECVDEASFVSDVVIPDDTYLSPGQSFVKTWRLRNSGTCTWTTDYALVFAGGHRMGSLSAIPLHGPVVPGDTADLSVALTAPAGNGNYEGKWLLRNEDGDLFGIGDSPGGAPFWARIIVGPPPTPAPMVTDWRGEYYGNRDLAGEPMLVRDDVEVYFNWNRDAPAAGLPADDFSARWTRTAEFDGTTYRFHAWADDGVRVWVDDRLIIDAWWDGGLRERTMDYAPVRGTHRLRVEFYERTAEARIHVWWEKVASPPYPDWKGEYWSNQGLSGSPALVRNDPSINFNWGLDGPAPDLPTDGFSARWSRTAEFDAGTYRFHVLVDDGARLWVDDRLILDTWRDGAAREVTADHAITGGPHHLRMEFYEYTGEARIHVWWKVAGPE